MIFRRRARFLVLVVCASLYVALLVLYPKAFRLRYSRELRRDFFGLSREALREGGVLGVVRVWAQAFSALVLTAIRRRRTTLPMERRVASAMVMMLQVAVVAVIVAMVSFWQAPPYEPPHPVVTKQPGDMHKARGLVWMAHTPNGRNHRVETWKSGGLALDPPGMPEQLEAIKNSIHTRSTAKEVIRRLDLKMTPAELLDNLAIETEKIPPLPGPRPRPGIWVERTYKDTDRERAEQILDMVGKVAFEKNNSLGYEKSKVFIPVTPGTPHPSKGALRNGGLTLAIGLALCLILKRRELKYVVSTRGAAREATYYLWGKGYAYYLSLGQTISAKVTAAVGLLIAVALSIASMVGGGGSKPAPFD